jgi:hypothetical protein
MSTDLPDGAVETTSVRIHLDRELPLVCVYCGEPAEMYFARTFTKTKPQAERSRAKVGVAVLLGLITFGILGHPHVHVETEGQSDPVRIPLCSEHRDFRRNYVGRSFLGGLYVLLSIGSIAALISSLAAAGNPGANTPILAVIAAASVCLVLAIVFALLASTINRELRKDNAITCHSVTDKRMILEGVAIQFAMAVEEKGVKETEHVDSFLDDLQ